MPKEHFLYLHASESVVANMAATILSGFIQKNGLEPGQEEAVVERSIELAIKIAEQVDQRVKSDEEWMKKNNAGGTPGL